MIIYVYVFPPKEFYNNLVNFEFLYGIWIFALVLEILLESLNITSDKTNNDLFIKPVSSWALWIVLSSSFNLSEPAKSIKFKTETIVSSASSV